MSRDTASDLFEGMCDDAAVLPPGSLPLAEAAPANDDHEESAYAPVVGPLDLGLLPPTFRAELTS